MARNCATARPGAQANTQLAGRFQERLYRFVLPLLEQLNSQLDVRLVRTFLATLFAIVQWRNRAHGLLLSELGGYLCSPDQAPAGTKRLSNLLRSSRWASSLLSDFLWKAAHERVTSLLVQGETPLIVWDESVLEKPESTASEGLCSVRSSKARRLKRIRKGFYNPPGGPPICVAGLNWLGALVVGRSSAPTVAAMRWWTKRGTRTSDHRTEMQSLLEQCQRAWKQEVLHVFDRGYASGPWLTTFLQTPIRFVVRWKKGQKLLDNWGESRKAWEITRGKRSQSYRSLRDRSSGETRKVGLVVVPVNHPSHAQPLWLVVARPGKGLEPWYLLTSETIRTSEDGWKVVLAYGRRWQIETAWRYSKSELAMESPRLWTWERREKLLLMATLVYAFLLSLLDPELSELRALVLRLWCHRTGKRSQDTPAPLYRLRSALSRLWQAYLPAPLTPSLNLG
ncbi:MAG: hypothetical protein OHK0022_26980 [Roseiflexaceae bacterium]